MAQVMDYEYDAESLNMTREDFEEPKRDLIISILYYLVFFFTLICIIADVIIVHVIIKFRRLREKKSNIIILNWTICNILYMKLAVVGIFLEWLLPYHLSWNIYTCIITEMCLNFLLGNVLFNVLLTMHWILEKHNPETLVKLERHMRFFIILNYVILLFCGCIHIMGCLEYYYFGYFSAIFAAFGFILYFVFTILVLIIDFIKMRLNRNVQYKRTINWWLTNAFFISYFPILVVAFLVGFLQAPYAITLFSCLIPLCNPIYNVIVLHQLDPDYKLFLNHIYTFKVRQYKEELKEEEIGYNNENQENTNIKNGGSHV